MMDSRTLASGAYGVGEFMKFWLWLVEIRGDFRTPC